MALSRLGLSGLGLSRLGLLAVGCAAALAALPDAATAQSYPSRAVRVLVATAAGGSTDLAARMVGQWMQDRLGQSFVVENRPGGANNIATEAALRAAPDGYTLLMANSVNATNATLFEKLPFDFLADSVPIAGVMRSRLVMQVHPSVPAKSVQELVALAKESTGRIVLGHAGNGSTGQIAAELFMLMSGTRLTSVPYRGETPVLTDLVGGHVQLVFATLGSSIEHLRAGKLKALAVTTTTRAPELPDAPSLAEVYPGYEVSSWSGLVAPKGTPASVIELLNREANAALADPGIIKRFQDLGSATFPGTPAAFGAFLIEDTERMGKIIKLANIKPS